MPINAGATSLTGQDLIDLATTQLGGYGNYPDTQTILNFLNEGKDEVWAILKNLNADFFMQISQPTDPTRLNYFGPLNPTTRQYTLPPDFREMHLIVVLDKAFAQVRFTYVKLQDESFRGAYTSANVDKSLTPTSNYHYTVIGKDQFLLAEYPETTFNEPQIFYVRNILDFEVDDAVDEVVLPFSKKIANYAAMRIMLTAQDQEQFEEWRKQWKDDILMVAQSAGPRNQANAEFVDDFLG